MLIPKPDAPQCLASILLRSHPQRLNALFMVLVTSSGLGEVCACSDSHDAVETSVFECFALFQLSVHVLLIIVRCLLEMEAGTLQLYF